ADQERRCSHHDDEPGEPETARTIVPRRYPRFAPAAAADQAVDDREHEQRRAKPHRPGYRQPLAIPDMLEPLMGEAAAAPGPRQEILRQLPAGQHGGP